MGRVIRRVPIDWIHPTEMDQYRKYGGSFPRNPNADHPLFDRPYARTCEEWKQAFADWESDKDGERSRIEAQYGPIEWWDWHGMPPDRAYYRDRDWTPEEATAYQVYENVTEGTPISPVFSSRDDLKRWLMTEWRMTSDGADNFIFIAEVPHPLVRSADNAEGVGGLPPPPTPPWNRSPDVQT